MSEPPEDWTTPDAHRVLLVGMFRLMNREMGEGIGTLPWNGTEADFRGEDADYLLTVCPGLRVVMEAGVRALAGPCRPPLREGG